MLDRVKFIIFFLIISIPLFSQNFDINSKIKEQAEEIVFLRNRNQNLIADSVRHKVEIHNLKRYYNYQIKKLEYDIVTLKWQQSRLNSQIDSLNKFKNEIINISKGSSIIYTMDQDPYSIFYIDLSKYNASMLDRGAIKLSPIYDSEKWRKFKFYGYPSPDNLSIYFYPYEKQIINFYKN